MILLGLSQECPANRLLDQPIFPRPSRHLLVVLGLYLLLGVMYVISIPMWEAPDEAAHFSYLNQVAEKWWPSQTEWAPIQHSGSVFARTYVSFVHISQRSQAPLYYWLSAPLLEGIYRLRDDFRWRGFPRMVATSPGSPFCFARENGFSTHDVGPLALRLSSLLLGAMTVYFTYALGLMLRLDEAIAIAGSAFCAFIPSFMRLSATINNDSLAIAFSTLSILAMAAWLRSKPTFPPRAVLLTVVAVPLALLSKLTAASLVPLGIWVLAKKCRIRHPVVTVLVLSVILIVGFDALMRLFPGLRELPFLANLHYRLFAVDFLSVNRLKTGLLTMHSSLWVSFGWVGLASVVVGPGAVSYVHEALPRALDLIALCGLIGFVRRYRRGGNGRDQLALLSMSLLIALIVVLRNEFASFWFSQFRYIFPVVSSMALLVATGIDELMSARGKDLLTHAWLPLGLINLGALLDYVQTLTELG